MQKIITAILLLTAFSVAAQQKKKPNIIYILADDLGYADVGCYGQQKTETPNIDALAAQGLKFTQYYSGSTVCAPARTTFMTGLHTGHTPIRGNKTLQPEGQVPLADSVQTIANILQKNGYNTGAFGKWSLGFITTSGDPNKKGFDEFYGYNCQSLAHDYYPDHLWSNHDRIDFLQNKKAAVTYSADTIHAEALQFINRQNNDRPFFLYLPYTLPHGDIIVPHDEVYDHYVKKFNDKPLLDTSKKVKKYFEPYPHAAFAAMVNRLDKYVGDIIRLVHDKGLEENTLIIFCSDNGPHKENGGDPDFFANHGIYRGIKRDLYEGGIRVPFIAYWKGKIQPGVTDQWLTMWDMFPTFEELAGVAITKNIDGISAAPTLQHHKKQQQHKYLYWEFHENKGRQAVRWKQWKLIKLNVNIAAETILELYDLDKDPGEQHNIVAQHTGIVKRMNKMIAKAHSPNADWPLLPDEVKGKAVVND